MLGIVWGIIEYRVKRLISHSKYVYIRNKQIGQWHCEKNIFEIYAMSESVWEIKEGFTGEDTLDVLDENIFKGDS